MTTIIEHAEAHYDVRETPYGKDYAWYPGHVIVECDCGERLSLTPYMTRCHCGEDHTSIVFEELNARRPLEEGLHPWREECGPWCGDRRLHAEYHHWLELQELE